jgi:hypothetical protein
MNNFVMQKQKRTVSLMTEPICCSVPRQRRNAVSVVHGDPSNDILAVPIQHKSPGHVRGCKGDMRTTFMSLCVLKKAWHEIIQLRLAIKDNLLEFVSKVYYLWGFRVHSYSKSKFGLIVHFKHLKVSQSAIKYFKRNTKAKTIKLDFHFHLSPT